MPVYECGYCGGRVDWSDEALGFVHLDDGERIPEGSISPGDFVSAAHNRAGTKVNGADLIESHPRSGPIGNTDDDKRGRGLAD